MERGMKISANKVEIGLSLAILKYFLETWPENCYGRFGCNYEVFKVPAQRIIIQTMH